MKIADPNVIETGEKNLIEAVREDLDKEAVWEILKARIRASSLSSRGGEIVVHNNQIAFRLDFDLQVKGSLIFDRQGNYIDGSQALEPTDALDSEEQIEFELHEPLPDLSGDPIPPPETGLEEIDLDEPDLEENISIDLPEYDLEPEFELELTDPVEDEPLVQEEMLDEDINDILKESRDFWDQKKES